MSNVGNGPSDLLFINHIQMILATRTDSAIYSDNDVIFIKPIDELWQHLKEMNEQQVAAIAPTTGHALSAGEDNVNLIPDPSGNIQINSGVSLSNTPKVCSISDTGEAKNASCRLMSVN